ncbi:MAG: DUF2269 family protein [Actinomycetota bacterium]
MSRYELWKYLHIVAAMVWVGGATVLQVLNLKAAGSGDPAERARIGGWSQWLGQSVFMPASIVVLVVGVVMVLDGPWEFSDPWIGLGLIGIVVTVVIGAVFITPTGKRLNEAMATRGPQDPVSQQLARRVTLLARFNLLLLVLLVFDMVVKPGT